MKAWISRGIGYYTVFPSQEPAIFWLSLQRIVEATLWAQKGLGKARNRREGGRAQLLKEGYSPRAKHKLIKIKWAQDFYSNSTKPWPSICKLNDTPRGAKPVPVQFSSVAQSCPTLCDPMNCSMSGFPLHHQLPEITQTHVHWVGDAIQPSHPLSSPSLPALNPSQHQGLFKWVSSSHQVAKVLEFQLQRLSFQWIFRTDFL